MCTPGFSTDIYRRSERFLLLGYFLHVHPSLPHTPSQVIYAQMFTDDITIYSRIFPSMCLLQQSFKVAYFLFLDKAHDLTFLENTSAFTEEGSKNV